MREELDTLLSLIPLDCTGPGNFFTGRYGPLRVQVALSGAGPERARKSAAELCKAGQPDLLLSWGLSGGLRHDLAAGDLVLADQTQTLNGCPEAASAHWMQRATKALDCRVGGLLSVPVVLARPGDKSVVAAACPNALALDMESIAVAEAARGAALPWLGLRCVSDTLSDALPLDFNLSMNRSGQVSRTRVVAQLARQPRALPDLLRFSAQVRRAQSQLLKGLDRLLGAVCW